MGEILHVMLERNARKNAKSLAIRFPAEDSSFTWEEVNSRANSLARYLVEEKQLQQGSRVALFIPNRPEFVIAAFAVWKAGAAVIPINVKFTAAEVEHIIQDSAAAVILAEDKLAPGILSLGAEIVKTGELPGIYQQFSEENLDLEISILDLAELLYTSGTTGKPKGVMLTHNAIHSVASMFCYEMDIRFEDRVLHLMPLTHSAPLNLLMVGAAYAGAVNVIGDFLPRNLLSYTANEKITHFFGAPVAYLLTAQMPDFDRYDLSSARYWIYGGAPMTREQVLLVQNKYPGNFVSVYGLTESGPNGAALYAHEHPEHAGSIGRRGVVNVEFKVVDDRGEEVKPGEVGEIIMKCPSMMSGYWNNPQATAETIVDGWLRTGDVARVDEDGYVAIIDRKKDLIISGGVNVYPQEVEAVLRQLPEVADVTVVGIPHAEWGETVMALIVPKPGEETDADRIKKFAAERLAGYKVPRIINFAAEIPRNSSGKVLKQVIKTEYGA